MREKGGRPAGKSILATALGLRSGGSVLEGDDFGGGHETILAEQFEKPLFVHRFPTKTKAFYMMPDPARPDA